MDPNRPKKDTGPNVERQKVNGAAPATKTLTVAGETKTFSQLEEDRDEEKALKPRPPAEEPKGLDPCKDCGMWCCLFLLVLGFGAWVYASRAASATLAVQLTAIDPAASISVEELGSLAAMQVGDRFTSEMLVDLARLLAGCPDGA